MKPPLSVVHVLPSLSVNEGGPARSVSQLCNALSADAQKMHVSLVSRAVKDEASIGVNPAVNSITVDSLSQLKHCLQQLHQQKRVDIVHQSGIWLPFHHQNAVFCHKNGVPNVVSPRGMFEPWALNHRKWKKRIAMLLYQKRDLRQAAAFHATAHTEAASVRRLGFTQPIILCPNAIELPPVESLAKHKADKPVLTALYLSRIHPVKGLPNLLEAWAKVAPENWRLRIAGNDDSGTLPRLREQAAQLGIVERVEFVGPLFADEQVKAYQSADLFILPSFSENFGVVIAEALSYGLPVLTTTGTPWGEIEQENCGWWVAPTATAIADALKNATAQSPEQRLQMGLRGRALIERKYQWPNIAADLKQAYGWLLGRNEKPSCVIEN